MRHWFLGLGLLMLLFFAHSLRAQENEFSQYRLAPLQVNPAEVAHSSDWRVIAHYRGQQVAGDIGFRTTQFTVMRPLFWGKRRYAGVGISVMDQRSADPGWFRFQRIGLSLAHEIPITKRERISLGVQTRYQVKRLSTEGVRTGSQFLPGVGFDPTLRNGEGDGLRHPYFSISAGGLWYRTDRHEQTTAYIGLSAFDLNRPRDTFFDAASSLPVVLQAHGGFQLLESGRATVSPEALWSYRTGIHLLNLGSRISYRLGASRTSSVTASRLDVVPRYTLNRSASLILQWHTESYTLGVSYDRDASFNALENPLRSAFELTIAWHQPVEPKQRTRRNRRKRNRRTTISRGISKLAAQPPVVEAFLADMPSILSTVPVTPPNAGLLAARQLTLIVEFAFNRSTINAQAVSTLQEVASFLQQQPNLFVTLTGHADGIGTPEANQRISVQRAHTVRDFLVRQGVSVERIKVEGRGAQAPLYPNTQEVLRAKNRRVEIGLGQ